MLNQQSTTDPAVMASNSNSNLTQKAKQMNDDITEFMRKRSRADPLCHAKYTTLVALGRKRQKAMRARREPPTLRPSLYSSKKRNADDQDVRTQPSAMEPAPVERRRSDQHEHGHSHDHSHDHSHEHSPPEDRRRRGGGGSDHCRPKRRRSSRRDKCGGKSHRRRRSSRRGRDGCKKRRRSRRGRSKCKSKRSRRRSKNHCKKARRHRSSRKCKPKRKRRC